MKTKIFLTVLLSSSALTLIGCKRGNEQINLNIFTKEETCTEIQRYEDLASMLSSADNEDFLLATYSKIYSTGCACWSGFRNDILNKYVSSTSIPVYYFDTDKLTGREEKFGIKED